MASKTIHPRRERRTPPTVEVRTASGAVVRVTGEPNRRRATRLAWAVAAASAS